MQIYLLFPLIRWVLKKTEGYHAWLFGAALAYQAWLTVGLHYKVGRHGNGALAQFLNAAGQGYWVDTYVLYVVAGALAGWHFERLCAFTRRHLRSGGRVALVAAAGVAAGIGVFLIETEVFGATPDNASAVFQPVVIFEALAFGWALLGAGLLWSDRGAPGRKFARGGLGQLVRHLPRPPARAAGAPAGRGLALLRRRTAASSAGCTACRTPASRC